MEKYRFRQVHFHLASTESFLRIHSPDKYGDLLSESRESVRLVNGKNIKVSGFEEGKVLNGFRNVYPLNYKNKPIGSVEISMSSASVMEMLSQLHESKDFYFIVEKSLVDKILDREIKSAKRTGQRMSLLLMDVDFFKKINDTYGHDWGDEVLKKVTREISENIREVDVFARWGGEEFVMFLPNTGKKQALIVGEKIRKLIDDSQRKELKDVTISIGITEVDLESYDINDAIKLADEAMYEAKRNGRNQIAFKD